MAVENPRSGPLPFPGAMGARRSSWALALGAAFAATSPRVVRTWVLYPAETLQDKDVEVKNITHLLWHERVNGLPTVFRWPQTLDSREEDGLGGGIAYAFDQRLCELLLPHFAEGRDMIKFYEFVNCDTVKDTVKSAFDVWQGNNRNIYFTDVTAICDGEDLWEDVDDNTCSSVTCRTCPLAEVVITLFESTPGDHSGARVEPVATKAKPLATNLLPGGGGSLKYVELQFGNNLCWYVDATFCGFFHTMEKNGLPVVAIVAIALGTLFLLSAIATVYVLYRLTKVFFYTLLATWDTDGDGAVEYEEIMGAGRDMLKSLRKAIKNRSFDIDGNGRDIELDDAIFAVLDVFARQLRITHLVVMLFGVILPVMLLNDVFLPCWNCYDFEAAAVHEIGHILGFDHPDQYPEYNFASDRSKYNCSAPWEGVSIDDSYDENSVMQAFLPRNPKTCLTEDDLDGLNFLYPVCTSNIQEDPVCVRANANIGFPRLLQAIVSAEVIPLVIVIAIKIISRIVLLSRDEFVEREARAEKAKAAQADKKRQTQLVRKRTQLEQKRAKREQRKGQGGALLNRPKTAPVQPTQSDVETESGANAAGTDNGSAALISNDAAGATRPATAG